MDRKWIMILQEVEEMWNCSATANALRSQDASIEEYCRERDAYKARRIYDMYGYDWFRRFVERCPHIQDLLDKHVPCEDEHYQCTMFCHRYNFEKGCMLNANE